MTRCVPFIFACAATAVGATLLSATAAYPQVCVPLAIAEQAVARQHGEHLFAVGQVGTRMMRLYANPATRSWTALTVDPEGRACLIGSGTNLEFVKPPTPKPGAPS